MFLVTFHHWKNKHPCRAGGRAPRPQTRGTSLLGNIVCEGDGYRLIRPGQLLTWGTAKSLARFEILSARCVYNVRGEITHPQRREERGEIHRRSPPSEDAEVGTWEEPREGIRRLEKNSNNTPIDLLRCDTQLAGLETHFTIGYRCTILWNSAQPLLSRESFQEAV